jgi:3-hydroxyacyl-CoA dehydrogenase/enoyl-CoA hydratase/3-hydroxybutyryl-CoA epimerase
MPVGPLAVTDEVAIELVWKVGKATAEALGQAFPANPVDEVVDLMAEKLGRKGKRSGAGFYDYPKDAKKHLWSGLAEDFPLSEKQPDVAEVEQRLLYIQALESARCLEENVLTHPADGDIGSIFGIGFPPWTGGVLSYIDTIGIKTFVAECDRLAKAYGSRFEVSPWLRDRAEKNQAFYS